MVVDNIMILCLEFTTLDATNILRLMMTEKTSGHGLRGLNAMNSSRLLMTCTTLSHMLKASDAMNSPSL